MVYPNMVHVQVPPPPLPVACKGDGLVPGLHLFHDFISPEQVGSRTNAFTMASGGKVAQSV
eukprot:1157707-Pelagomonas_calceolata.AAC.9